MNLEQFLNEAKAMGIRRIEVAKNWQRETMISLPNEDAEERLVQRKENLWTFARASSASESVVHFNTLGEMKNSIYGFALADALRMDQRTIFLVLNEQRKQILFLDTGKISLKGIGRLVPKELEADWKQLVKTTQRMITQPIPELFERQPLSWTSS